jgi:hypothetical protein
VVYRSVGSIVSLSGFRLCFLLLALLETQVVKFLFADLGC